jgi:hypothetical protein
MKNYFLIKTFNKNGRRKARKEMCRVFAAKLAMHNIMYTSSSAKDQINKQK